jgi:stress-induced morphogen
MISPNQLEQRLINDFPDAIIEVIDLTGGMNHYRVKIVSSSFNEKNLVQRHRMIYECLKTEMRSDIHALSLETITPEENLKN